MGDGITIIELFDKEIGKDCFFFGSANSTNFAKKRIPISTPKNWKLFKIHI